jgi:hypothetical protein
MHGRQRNLISGGGLVTGHGQKKKAYRTIIFFGLLPRKDAPNPDIS